MLSFKFNENDWTDEVADEGLLSSNVELYESGVDGEFFNWLDVFAWGLFSILSFRFLT